MACDSLLMTSCRKLSTGLFQVHCQSLLFTALLQVVLTSCNKFANDKFNKSGLFLPVNKPLLANFELCPIFCID